MIPQQRHDPPRSDEIDLSIIVVNYRTYDLTKQTIKSVLDKDHPFIYEIVLVDNASCDGSLEKLKKDFSREEKEGRVRFIINTENRGFAHANNQALKETDSRYVLLLNSDTVIVDDCLERCIDYMERDNKIGALGCKVLLSDGKLDKACRRSFPTVSVSFYRMTGLSKLFPKSERFGRYNLTYLDEDETYEVECIVGAFMMVRSSTIKEIGLLDETFFMYGEDIDWCHRIKAGNWKIVYYSDAQIIHYKGGSLNKKEKPKMIYEFYRAMHVFYDKHYKDNNPKVITAVTYLGIWSMYALKRFINLFK